MTVAIHHRANRANTLDLTPDLSFAARQRMAWLDLAETARLWRLCWTLAWLDIKLRYRGSMLGPFWLTLSTAAMVGSMGVVYAILFRMDLHLYLPFLALSLVLWGYLSSVMTEGCMTFTTVESMIRSVRMPYSLYAARIVVRNLLVLAHNVVVIVAVYALLQAWPGADVLMVLPGIALWLVDSLAVCILLGAVCARFRDIPPIVGSIIQMAFFISAVIWTPGQLGAHEWMLDFNPFFTLLEVVRAPLLGGLPGPAIWASALAWSAALCGSSWLLFARVRGRVAFWV
jgi:lipopolysaccharide transport system permease protein